MRGGYLPNAGHAVMVVGPSGSGKSSLARDALLEEGSGIICLAPGVDEVASYLEFQDEEGYEIESFLRATDIAPWLTKLYQINLEHYKKHQEPLHKVLVSDTLSGFDQIIRGEKIKAMGLTEPLFAIRSPQGAEFYLGIQYKWEKILAVSRALRGLGIHWIALSHAKTRPPNEETMEGTGLEAPEIVQPLVTGATRDSLPGAFDLVFHSGITNHKQETVFTLLCKSDPTKVTKSRFGELVSGKVIRNYWKPTVELIEKAIELRKREFTERREKK